MLAIYRPGNLRLSSSILFLTFVRLSLQSGRAACAAQVRMAKNEQGHVFSGFNEEHARFQKSRWPKVPDPGFSQGPRILQGSPHRGAEECQMPIWYILGPNHADSTPRSEIKNGQTPFPRAVLGVRKFFRYAGMREACKVGKTRELRQLFFRDTGTPTGVHYTRTAKQLLRLFLIILFTCTVLVTVICFQHSPHCSV